LVAVVAILSLGAVAPASAEFFGCNEPGAKTYSYSGKPRYAAARTSYASARHTHEFSAQAARPRVTITPRTASPGPNAKRYCRSWLAKEYRVSGTVIVPRMQCWWQ
jgi:hypothetical protein